VLSALAMRPSVATSSTAAMLQLARTALDNNMDASG